MTLELKDKLYTSTQVSDILGVSLRTLYRYMEDGKIESLRTASGRHRFTREHILGFLNDDKSIDMKDIINPDNSDKSTGQNLYSQDDKYAPQNNAFANRNYDRPTNTAQTHDDLNSYSNNINNQNIRQNTDQNTNSDPFRYNVKGNFMPTNQYSNSNIQEVSNLTTPSKDFTEDDEFIAEPKPQTHKNIEPEVPINKYNNSFDFLDDDFLAPNVKENIKPNNLDNDLDDYSQLRDISNRNTTPNVTSQLNDKPVMPEPLNIEYYKSSNPDIVELASLIKKSSAENDVRYAFTCYAGASLNHFIKPFTLLHFYIDAYDKSFWIKTLNLEPSDSEQSNIALIIDKEFRYLDINDTKGFKVVNNLRLKSDLTLIGEDSIASNIS